MTRILFKLADGSVHALSQNVYGSSGPLSGRDASVQLSLITEHLRYFSSDDGTIVFTQHIVSAKIEN